LPSIIGGYLGRNISHMGKLNLIGKKRERERKKKKKRVTERQIKVKA
jgi:hypothetical protein